MEKGYREKQIGEEDEGGKTWSQNGKHSVGRTRGLGQSRTLSTYCRACSPWQAIQMLQDRGRDSRLDSWEGIKREGRKLGRDKNEEAHFAGDDVHRVQLTRQGAVRARQVGDDGIVGREGDGIGCGAAWTRKGRDVLECDAAVAKFGLHVRLLVPNCGHGG